MIIYDLQCTHDHKFEGWFKSREEYDRENEAQRLTCPIGPGFAEEALKMHFEEIDHRNIRGTMTDDEEKELQDEGVEYIKVPVRKFSS
jgi:hypothetical protein